MLGLQIFVKGFGSDYKQRDLNSKGLTTRIEKTLWNKLAALVKSAGLCFLKLNWIYYDVLKLLINPIHFNTFGTEARVGLHPGSLESWAYNWAGL